MRRLSLALACFSIAALVACESVGPDAATIIVENRSSDKVTVRFSACSDDTWGGSRGSVGSGEERSWRVNPGCWDVRAEWDDTCGSERRGQELGPNATFRFTVDEPPTGFCD